MNDDYHYLLFDRLERRASGARGFCPTPAQGAVGYGECPDQYRGPGGGWGFSSCAGSDDGQTGTTTKGYPMRMPFLTTGPWDSVAPGDTPDELGQLFLT